jgi:hypothetical protein
MICVLNKLRGIRKPNNLIFFGRKKLKGLNRIAIFSKTSTVKKQNYMNMHNTTNSISSDISTQKYQMRSVAPARKYCSACSDLSVSFSQRILNYLAFEFREAYSVHKSSLHNNGVLTYNLSYFTKRLGLDQETSLSLPCFNEVPVSR